MFIFGLTGPSGAGKGTITELFAKYKVYSVDTDAVYHRLLIPPSACLDELTARFGTGVLSPDGSLNRQALAAVVFSDDNALADLNAITHKYILARTKEALDLYRAGNSGNHCRSGRQITARLAHHGKRRSHPGSSCAPD